MNSSEGVDLQQPQRQSLWAVVFLALRTLRQVGLVQLVLFVGFVSSRLPSVKWFVALVALVAVVTFVIATLQWWRYTFQIRGDELIVQQGVLDRQSLTVPLDRVQSVSLEQQLLHRTVSLVQVTLDTAGAATPEFVIDAVEHRVASALQRATANFAGRAPHATEASAAAGSAMPPPPEQIVVRHGWRRIVMIALTHAPFTGLVVVWPLLAAADDLRELVPFGLPQIDEPTAGPWLLWFVPLIVLVGLAISLFLNLVRVLLREWNLTVHVTKAGLRRNAGLLSTTSVAATIPRIQMVGARQTVLQRLAGLQVLTMGTIGLSNMVIPGCDAQDAATLRNLALAGSAGVMQPDRAVSEAEVFRLTRKAFVVAVIAAGAAVFAVGWPGIFVLLSVPVAWALARRMVALRRWGVSQEAIADHRQLFGWHRRELLLRKVNAVTVRQTVFERKRGLASVELATANGSLSIGMVPLAEAQQLRDETLRHVETDRRSWM